jgi:7-cyano-7-deazaguanine synthase
MSHRALVLFSGGQDSTTALVWANSEFVFVETIGFDYGQKHRVELECRQRILEHWGSGTDPEHLRPTQFNDRGLPPTFIPARNLLFLSYAAALAYNRGIRHIVLGVCETDYSGYPDCRDNTIKAMQVALSLGLEWDLVLHTPLMNLDKERTWEMAYQLGGDKLVDLIINDTHTCYEGIRDRPHEWGVGCGACAACVIRANGFEKWRLQWGRR